jgi:hypothetical protein
MKPVLPPLLGCPCGIPNQLRTVRRGTVSHLRAIECRFCKRRSPAAADPVKVHENWNDKVRGLLQREAFR